MQEEGEEGVKGSPSTHPAAAGAASLSAAWEMEKAAGCATGTWL